MDIIYKIKNRFDKKYLSNKTFPEKLIYQALHSLVYRLGKYKAGNPYSRRIREDIFRRHLFTEREERYRQEIELLSDILDIFGLHDGYRNYKRQTTDSCLTDMMSAQYIHNMANVIEDGEYEIVGHTATTADDTGEENNRK